jgi:hypothetical protein
MSGANNLPASIGVTQNAVGPSVTITQVGGVVLPAGVPPYPLAADPSQTWDLQDVNGVLTWVQFSVPPGQSAWWLEDLSGVLLLEDGDGCLLMEP